MINSFEHGDYGDNRPRSCRRVVPQPHCVPFYTGENALESPLW